MADYRLIYTDIIAELFPEKADDPKIKNRLDNLNTTVDILKMNVLVFGQPEYAVEFKNQRLRSYDEGSVREILSYQNKNKLTNTETANHFKISRNTIAKWKAVFKV
ncbi:helix-turn-helix domain-containing protein [Chryseobacterium sp. L7]|uniref:Helix-turn-helix domain-containing protein n=1 Tax=Chryseobacterium endalhagicum TaxID=2797638 RepID=A0ABS1QIM7_9FLAO|nr:helix-turn-helix domain-containing protein [Chryseobacterium endalhagicum]MBL1221919.1 helix-turn-helix domain-containing protein [Chryseobacterium endalhagicum]